MPENNDSNIPDFFGVDHAGVPPIEDSELTFTTLSDIVQIPAGEVPHDEPEIEITYSPSSRTNS